MPDHAPSKRLTIRANSGTGHALNNQRLPIKASIWPHSSMHAHLPSSRPRCSASSARWESVTDAVCDASQSCSADVRVLHSVGEQSAAAEKSACSRQSRSLLLNALLPAQPHKTRC